ATTSACSDKGRQRVGPYIGAVRPKIVTTGQPTAAARWAGPLSLVASTRACFNSQPNSPRLVFPARFKWLDEPAGMESFASAPMNTGNRPNSFCTRSASWRNRFNGQRAILECAVGFNTAKGVEANGQGSLLSSELRLDSE